MLPIVFSDPYCPSSIEASMIKTQKKDKHICSPLVLVPSKPGKIEMYSSTFYAAYTAGCILSCGLTHVAVTPLDLVKCNM
nr:mitochondrial phosphate carrier protein 3, mitochondrial [Quercus suber]